MATNQSSFTLTKREKRKLMGRAAKLGFSFSNYVRFRLGLEPLIHGGARKRKKAAEQPTEGRNDN